MPFSFGLSHFRARTVLVLARLAVGAEENQEPDTAYQGDKTDENKPTAFPDIMKPSHSNGQRRDKNCKRIQSVQWTESPNGRAEQHIVKNRGDNSENQVERFA